MSDKDSGKASVFGNEPGDTSPVCGLEEAVARAMYELDMTREAEEGESWMPWERLVTLAPELPYEVAEYRERARAAIAAVIAAALLDPSEEVVEAAERAIAAYHADETVKDYAFEARAALRAVGLAITGRTET